jgi:hypothetical protein
MEGRTRSRACGAGIPLPQVPCRWTGGNPVPKQRDPSGLESTEPKPAHWGDGRFPASHRQVARQAGQDSWIAASRRETPPRWRPPPIDPDSRNQTSAEVAARWTLISHRRWDPDKELRDGPAPNRSRRVVPAEHSARLPVSVRHELPRGSNDDCFPPSDRRDAPRSESELPQDHVPTSRHVGSAHSPHNSHAPIRRSAEPLFRRAHRPSERWAGR